MKVLIASLFALMAGLTSQTAEARHFETIHGRMKVFYSNFNVNNILVGQTDFVFRDAQVHFTHLLIHGKRFDGPLGVCLFNTEVGLSQVEFDLYNRTAYNVVAEAIERQSPYGLEALRLIDRYFPQRERDDSSAHILGFRLARASNFFERKQIHDDVAPESVHVEVEVDPSTFVTH